MAPIVATSKATSVATVAIPEIKVNTLEVRLVGDSPLIVHRWSEKARKEMLDKQMGIPTPKKEKKDPERDYQECFYYLPDGRYGFPAIAFKAAAVDAATQLSGLTKVYLRGAFHVAGDLAVIEGTPTKRQDMVRVGMGTADIRFRPEFKEWNAVFQVRYNVASLTRDQVIQLFDQAGFSVGIGEWRPSKDGAFGMFHVGSVAELD